MIIPTLAADATLDECVLSVAGQSIRDVEIIVVDNSGQALASRRDAVTQNARVIGNSKNAGFGGAVNQGIRESKAPFIAVLNDDAVADPEWLAAMLAPLERQYEIGMCAPRIGLKGTASLDSAGMLIARDGSSKQRGHGEPLEAYARPGQILLPSGCAALYRRDMLDEIGLFDERFFLYCEDTDLGLRARWKLWECAYAPDAIVHHRYSHSAGQASAMKAFYVERNRVFLVIKNFTPRQLAAVPLFSLVRYFWHVIYLARGTGKAADYQRNAGNAPFLPWVALRAWLSALGHLGGLLHDRRAIRKAARANPRQFERLLSHYRISERQVASL